MYTASTQHVSRWSTYIGPTLKLCVCSELLFIRELRDYYANTCNADTDVHCKSLSIRSDEELKENCVFHSCDRMDDINLL